VKSPRRVVLPLALAAVALAALTIPAPAAPDHKRYLAVVSPDSVGAGQTIEYSFTATNLSSSQSLGSINLTVPPDFTLMSVTQQPRRSSDGAFVGTANVAGSTRLELRNLSLAPSTSTTVRFRAQAPCVQGGTDQWGLAAKQSNDFNGTRNDFSPTTESQRTTDVTGVCQLNWTSQPSDAKVNQRITSTAFDAVDGTVDGPRIKAEVLSAAYPNSSRTRVTFSDDELALDVGADPNLPDDEANLSGTTSATAVAGLATFTPGPVLDLHGLNYTLLVTNPAMNSDESGTFDISDAAGDCSKNNCDNLTANGNSMSANLSSTSTEGVIAMSIGVLPELLCPGYVPNPQQQAVTITPLGVSAGSTMTVRITILADIVDRPASQYRICWASTKTFTERDGTDADPVTIAGDPMVRGLLPDCATNDPIAPCQIKPSRKDAAGNVTLRVLAPGDDPHAR
jgi:hypothetical protein